MEKKNRKKNLGHPLQRKCKVKREVEIVVDLNVYDTLEYIDQALYVRNLVEKELKEE